MQKLLFFILFCTLGYTTLFAQTDKDKTTAFQVSFVPPLSSNGIQSYKYTNGISLNLLAGISKNEKVFALGGYGNIILNNATGLQLAGISNYIGNCGKGASIAGVITIAKKSYKGFQLAGITNYTGKMTGFQLAGVANIAGDVTGLQLGGIMNKARNVSGVQIAGILNIAKSSRYPIGLINIIKDGEMGIAVTYNETGSTMVTFRSGGDVTYGIIGIGYNHKTSERSYVTEAGLGAHINCLPWLRINNELKVGSFAYSDSPLIADDNPSTPAFHANYSILPAFRLSPHFELFGGPSINYMNMKNNGNENLLPNHSIWEKDGDSRLQRLYIGYQVGVQYIF